MEEDGGNTVLALCTQTCATPRDTSFLNLCGVQSGPGNDSDGYIFE